MLRVVSHDRPIALANTSSDCELVSRVSYSIAAVGRFDIARRRWATAAAPPAICFGPACYIGGNIGGAWTNVSVTDNFTGSEVSRKQWWLYWRRSHQLRLSTRRRVGVALGGRLAEGLGKFPMRLSLGPSETSIKVKNPRRPLRHRQLMGRFNN